MTITRTRPLAALAVAAALLAAAAAALPADADAAPKLRRGVYDCFAYNSVSGFLDYKGSVKLLSRNRYEHAFGRKRSRLEKPTRGTYRVRGSRLTFKGGGMRHTPGRIRPASGSSRHPFFDVYVNGEKSGISCYFVKRP